MRALKVRNINAGYYALSELRSHYFLPRGDAPRLARRLPLAVIFRAFGAARKFWFLNGLTGLSAFLPGIPLNVH